MDWSLLHTALSKQGLVSRLASPAPRRRRFLRYIFSLLHFLQIPKSAVIAQAAPRRWRIDLAPAHIVMIDRPLQPEQVIQQALRAVADRTGAAAIGSAEADALDRLLAQALQDSGQSRVVADFLLAWWNSASCGGFDPTSLWSLDAQVAADIMTVLGLIVRSRSYPDSLGYEAEFAAIVQAWRPSLPDR
jgi:hypothetical protein